MKGADNMQPNQRPTAPLVVLIILAVMAMQSVNLLTGPPDKLFSDWIASLSGWRLLYLIGHLAFVVTALFAIRRLWNMKASAVSAYALCVLLWAALLALKDAILVL